MIDAVDAEMIDALVPQVAFDGWTTKAVRSALVALGRDPADAVLMYPNGAAEMITTFCALADERMAAAAVAADLAAYRVPARVKAIIAIRLEQNAGNKEAIRRALSWMALPSHARTAARITAATVDAVWHAAGDTSADFSWYTKRGILGAVYSATLLFWLRDSSENDEETLNFLDRRLADVARIGGLRKTVEARVAEAKTRLVRLAPGRA
jgi:ubiquinone biosynthesis protein COQ9